MKKEIPELATIFKHLPPSSSPIRIGVFFSGGPAPGGNNVIVGLFHALKKINQENALIGFLGGPKGLIEDGTKVILEPMIEKILGRGGFDFLGTGRTKIETEEQLQKAYETIKRRNLSGIVCIGGDDTNTNAYYLSEYLKKQGSPCIVVGIPKTIDGDVKSKEVEISFGFDTATKIYSEMIGNICVDAASSLKYWHFIKLMGRSASHVALECGIKTQANITLISEEVLEKKMTLEEVVSHIATVIEKRSQNGKNYGVVLIPEGLIEYIPEVKALISEINRLLAANKGIDELSLKAKEVFEKFPNSMKQQLLLDRDPHGNVQVAKIETEKLLSLMCQNALEKKGSKVPFSCHHHYFGYEGRCGDPSIFDATYCYNLGYVAVSLIREKKSGYIAALKNLAKPVLEWVPLETPLASMMQEEERKGVIKKVVQKAYVDLKGPVFQYFAKNRTEWEINDLYLSPGPIQFYGDERFLITKTLSLESENKN